MQICHRCYHHNRWILKAYRESRALLTSTTTNDTGNEIRITRDALRAEVLTLIHKTEVLFPKILPKKSSYFQASQDALNRSHECISLLNTGVFHKGKIVGEQLKS
jgi:hypothetical protein